MKSVHVKSEIVINCSRQRVAAFASNPDNVPQWYVNIHRVEWETPKPLAMGSLIAFHAKFLGKHLAYVYKVTWLDPENRLVMRTENGPFPMETTYTWEELPLGRTRMTLQNAGTPSGFSRLITPFLSILMKLANQKDLKLLKKILEKNNQLLI